MNKVNRSSVIERSIMVRLSSIADGSVSERSTALDWFDWRVFHVSSIMFDCRTQSNYWFAIVFDYRKFDYTPREFNDLIS